MDVGQAKTRFFKRDSTKADKLTNVEPPIREEFARLAVAVQQRAAMREVGTGPQRR